MFLQGCQSRVIHRSSTLEKHFVEEHQHLNNVSIRLPSNVLRPLWTPFSPSQSLPMPPPLPVDLKAGSVLATSCPSSIRKKNPLFVPSSSPPTSPFSSPRKQSQRQIPQKDPAEDALMQEDLSILEFEPLPAFSEESARNVFEDLIVWRRPTASNMDVSRPQRMWDTPIPEPPISILYDVFAKRFAEIKFDG